MVDFDDTSLETAPFKRSGFYTVTDVNGSWWSVLNLRHRNGEGDGPAFGFQLRTYLTEINSALFMRKQVDGSWSDWEEMVRFKVLYDNSAGTTGTVTLSESAANFSYLEIFAVRNSYMYSTRACNPNGKTVALSTSYITGSYMYFYSKHVNINETSITVNFQKLLWISPSDGGNGGYNDDNAHEIVKVIGYR